MRWTVRATLVCGLVVILFGVEGLLQSHGYPGRNPLDGVRVGVALVAMFGSYTCIRLQHDHVWLDSHGITVISWGSRNRFISWNDIWSIEPLSTLGYRSVRVRTRQAPARLPVPRSEPGSRNEAFDAELGRIIDWWQRHRTEWPPPPADVTRSVQRPTDRTVR